ncbi:MFS transporter [Rhodococcus hoagii]|nr:MFS transporter [Prescottella equi]
MSRPVPQSAVSRNWAGLAMLALPALLIAVDMTCLYVTIPHLSEDLGPTATQLLWINDIYGFFIAGALVPMGALGDRIGRRRLLLLGAALFGAASILAAWAPNAEALIAARAVLGLAGATLMPSTLSLARVMFDDDRRRTLAVSVIMAAFSVGTALGPLASGLLLNYFWWGSVFLMAVPVTVLLLLVGPRTLPEYRDPTARSIDLPSAALSMSAVLALVYAIKHAAASGFDARAAAFVLVGLVAGAVFVRRQRTLDDPLLDLTLLRNRLIRSSLGTYTLGLLAMAGTQLFVVLYLQQVLGLGPLQAGMWMVPAALGTLASSLVAPFLIRRWRPAVVIGGSLTVSVLGFLLLTRVGVDDLPLLMVGYVAISLGVSPVIALCTDIVVSSAPAERAGSAAALSETGAELGAALGVALLGSLGFAVHRGSLGADPASVVSSEAVADGLVVAAGASAAVVALTALVSVAALRRIPVQR